MNRVLYQLSYAAIGQTSAFAEISFVIISMLPRFVKGNVQYFSIFFGKADGEGVFYNEILEKESAVCHWRQRLCGVGAALARQKPWQYVPGRGQQLSGAGQAGAVQMAAFSAYAGRGRQHHSH